MDINHLMTGKKGFYDTIVTHLSSPFFGRICLILTYIKRTFSYFSIKIDDLIKVAYVVLYEKQRSTTCTDYKDTVLQSDLFISIVLTE